MGVFSCVMIGEESLLVQCGEILLRRGHAIRAVATRDPDVAAWARGAGLAVAAPGRDLAARLPADGFDWLLSVANLALIPEDALALARRGAINFHDGPLPRRAGLNAPVWALLEGERRHGVTWHLIGGGIDEGAILAQRMIEVDADETALTLNAKCWAAAIESFEPLVAAMEAGDPPRTPQDLSLRTYHARADRPAAAALLDFRRDAEAVAAFVRALDHGHYWNPLAVPKIVACGRAFAVGTAEAVDGDPAAASGTVLEAAPGRIVVATGRGAVALGGLTDLRGRPAEPPVTAGAVLPAPDAAEAAALTEATAALAAQEHFWRPRLRALAPARAPQAGPGGAPAAPMRIALALPAGIDGPLLAAVVGVWAARSTEGGAVDLAWRDADLAAREAATGGCAAGWTPLRVEAGDRFGVVAAGVAEALAEARRRIGFAADLWARDPALRRAEAPDVAVAVDAGVAPVGDAALTVAASDGAATLVYDAARLPASAAAACARQIETLAAAAAAPGGAATPARALPLLSSEERARLLREGNDTALEHDRSCVHAQIARQAAATPDAVALVVEGTALSYAELDARADRVAHVLRGMGVGPDVLVGLCAPRSLELVIGALAILKAGGAYVPLDPAYPADRIALYVEDSGAPVIVAHSAVVSALPAGGAQVLEIDRDPRIAAAPEGPVDGGAAPENLAYVIYTSGSTGRPKGVMIEHRNVANFFAGMDARIGADGPGAWLAVTSLSFDISVLELFYTLARGYKVVLSGDESRTLISNGPLGVSDRPMDFSLFYWGNDDGVGPRKYELLLEGARFADANGFCAVWTPERHFHAFGGPYPNPSVTGAAVAAVTKNLAVRAGSCVAPLHHPARIAEEWAVIDNLTNGRVGLAIASGWQPDDFVLRPENTPPKNRAAMLESIDVLRRLWRGEAVAFPTASGAPFPVVTQPRPVSKELPVWVTTAGNPATWKEAGAIGANVLTHLLGQSVAEVGEKIVLYRDALRVAGHDPSAFKVTLMLHTFVGADREAVREAAREPMKDYLRSAAALIKQYAWAFPAFKRPAGVSNPMEIDLQTLSEEEMEGVLDFAFQRYFDDSGLFGTVEDCLARVEQLKRIGVDEIACLIDYGVPTAQVLEGLRPLAEVARRANSAEAPAEDDWSVAAQIVRHRVTHLQCTPSMARMICLNDEARQALGRIRLMMVGGEPLPGALVAELRGLTDARIENMYGPTETTIWSSTRTAEPVEGVVDIGRPIANTRLYVLDEAREPVSAGAPGELWIAGEGVARGYHRRPDLTAERFLPDPFAPPGTDPWAARMYRTGDLVRRRADGGLDFLGRADHQVKIRGHRIELGEIEARLAALPQVREAVALAREDAPGDVRLVGYVTLRAPVDEAALRAALAAVLPEHMVPAHVVSLDAMPLTPNKKVDRKVLPAPAAAAPARRAAAAEAPRSDVERVIADVWRRVLGVAEVGPRDNFFELGGHSLLAVQAHRALREALGATRLSITDVFRYPTLAALAAHLDDRPAGAAAPDDDDAVGARAQARADAMARRRALRAGKQSEPA